MTNDDLIKEIISKLKEERKNIHSVEELVNFSFDFKFKEFSISPIQIKSEIQNLVEILSKIKPKNVLEIGTANGGTLFLLCEISDPKGVICSIDLPDGSFGGELYPMWKAPIYQTFKKKYQKLFLLREDSHKNSTKNKVKELMENDKFDFILIDGDHTYEGVKQDFDMYSTLLKTNGIIAFHDINPGPSEYVGGVPKFWNEIRMKYKSIEIKEKKSFGGYGIGLVFLEPRSTVDSVYEKIIKIISGSKDKKLVLESEIERKKLIIEHPLSSLLFVYRERQDLKEKFPEVKKGIFKNFMDWAIHYGIKEYKEVLFQHKKWYENSLSELIKKEENEKI